jgi:hypothetical protein
LAGLALDKPYLHRRRTGATEIDNRGVSAMKSAYFRQALVCPLVVRLRAWFTTDGSSNA